MEKKNIVSLEKNKLPQTESKPDAPSSGCCGGTPVNNAEACCKIDEDKKEEGEEGCGCNTTGTGSKKSSCC
jgi:hypothetical protein